MRIGDIIRMVQILSNRHLRFWMQGAALALGWLLLEGSAIAQKPHPDDLEANPVPTVPLQPAPVQTPSDPASTVAPSTVPFSIDQGLGYVSHIEVDLSDRRLTLYQNATPLQEYPIAVGREGWATPTGNFQVMQMYENPDWMNPLTGGVIPGGDPSNPLGQYWIGFWTDGNNWIGLHGTPDTSSIGQAISHGCVRLHNHHIQEIFNLVQVGTQVVVIP